MSFESEGTKNKLLLKNIDTLSFIRGRNTKARRLEPISQLTCAGNNIDCDNADIDFVTCHNTYLGEELDSLQYWKCSAEMPTQYSFKDTEVSCEGYSYSGDPHILDGSCGLKYTLNYHPDGKRKGKESASSNAAGLFLIVWFALLFFIIYKIYTQRNNRTNSPGFNNDDPNNPPPPPYSEIDPDYDNSDHPNQSSTLRNINPRLGNSLLRSRQQTDTAPHSSFEETSSSHVSDSFAFSNSR